MIQSLARRRWAVVLAAGEGSRLRQLTMGADGVPTPKQFCSLDGERSLLEETLARAARLASLERTLVVVAAEQERWWTEQLESLPRENIVVQPRNRGTAAGILLALSVLNARDPEALVALLPSDHFVADDGVLDRCLEDACGALARPSDEIVLLGITPDAPECEYGWIVPGARMDAELCTIESFVEKPDAPLARQMHRDGAMWSSFLIVAGARTLTSAIRRRLPELAFALLGCERLGRRALEQLYEHLPAADFSRDVLQGAESQLRVLRVPPCGWTDLGTPQRVAQCLRRHRSEALEPRVEFGSLERVLDLGRAVLREAERAVHAS